MMSSFAFARPLTPAVQEAHTDAAWCSKRRKAPEHNREWGRADPVAALEAPAAPATVSGEGVRTATGPNRPGKAGAPFRTASQETGLPRLNQAPSGVTAGRT